MRLLSVATTPEDDGDDGDHNRVDEDDHPVHVLILSSFDRQPVVPNDSSAWASAVSGCAMHRRNRRSRTPDAIQPPGITVTAFFPTSGPSDRTRLDESWKCNGRLDMSTVGHLPHPADAPRRADSSLGRAWAAIVLIPVFAILSFAAGVVTLSAFGYSSGGDEPLWVNLVVSIIAMTVLLLPCVAAVLYGRRARRAGVRGAVAPMAIGAVVGAAGIVLTIVTAIGDALR